MNKCFFCLVRLLLIVCTALPVWAEVRLPAIIGSHMVLQQRSTVNLWGWCEPNEKVKVSTGWDTTTFRVTGSSQAKWRVAIPTPAAGGPFTITISGGNTLVLEDVMIGEVWVCSGQSNMEMSVNWGLTQYGDDVAHATSKSIRFFHIPKSTADFPQDDTRGSWVVCNPNDMKRFSAAGYFFGQKLQQELNVPVGLINASWGGTPAEVWTPAERVKNDAVLQEAAAKLKPANGWPVDPGISFNAMIYPLTRFTIAGAIWYQGESNVGTWSAYQPLLSAMIASWRAAWHKEFPFYYVQIAPYAGYGSDNVSSALLREAQTRVLVTPGTGMVVISDLVDNIRDIHPKIKKEVGLRLAGYALAETYGRNGKAYKSPMYSRMQAEKDKIRVYFENAEKGLVSKRRDSTGFYIAGDDRHFLPAEAKIEGSSVVVWNKQVKNPVAVRFGFTNASMPVMFSTEGLPVNLFRTDNWPAEIGIPDK